MNRQQIIDALTKDESGGAFKVSMGILDGDEETVLAAQGILDEQDQEKMKAAYGRQVSQSRKQDVSVGGMTITNAGGPVDLVLALKEVMEDKG